jgi:hypothetical protein
MPTVVITGTNRSLGFEFVKQYTGRWLVCVRDLRPSNIGR